MEIWIFAFKSIYQLTNLFLAFIKCIKIYFSNLYYRILLRLFNLFTDYLLSFKLSAFLFSYFVSIYSLTAYPTIAADKRFGV